jgi:hypothetical protein
VNKTKDGVDKNDFLKNCMKLAVFRNLPMCFFDYPEFHEIVKPISQKLNISINSRNMATYIQKSADSVIEKIKQEVANKLICLKCDCATRLNKSILGLYCQYIQDGKIIVRTLAMIEMNMRHTGENLKDVILDVLSKYGIKSTQIYSSTTDNASNMIKAGKLLEEQQDLDLSICSENEVLDDNTTQNTVHESLSGVLSIIRCSAHTLQLVVHDFFKNNAYKEAIAKIRSIMKVVRTPTYRRIFLLRNVEKPKLDVDTRWNSTYEMVKHIHDNKNFYEEFSEFDYDHDFWKFVEEFVQCFGHVYIATKKLQEEQLIAGDFYKTWLNFKLI